MRYWLIATLLTLVACGRFGYDPQLEAADAAGATDAPDACAGSSCKPAFDWSVPLRETQQIPPGAIAGDEFGSFVAIDGNTLVAGAPGVSNVVAGGGAAYVFTWNGAIWSLEDTLQPAGLASGEGFGKRVAIDGDTIVVGVERRAGRGAAFVFVRDAGSWSLQQELVGSDTLADDDFGNDVECSGDTLIVGARRHDAGGMSAGAAYVFTRTGASWTEQQKLQATPPQVGGGFAKSVGLDGDIAIVGSEDETHSGLAAAGAAYVFTRTGTAWGEQQRLVASDPRLNAQFGKSADISATTLVVGASNDASGGAAYVFSRSGSWVEKAKLLPLDLAGGDSFGIEVGIDGDNIIVGSSRADSGAVDGGAVYFFSSSAGVWSQVQKVTATSVLFDDRYGESVAISADIAAFGSAKSDASGTDSGGVVVLQIP